MLIIKTHELVSFSLINVYQINKTILTTSNMSDVQLPSYIGTVPTINNNVERYNIIIISELTISCEATVSRHQ